MLQKLSKQQENNWQGVIQSACSDSFADANQALEWITFGMFASQNAGLPIEQVKNVLQLKNEHGQHLIPHFSVPQSQEIFVVSDASDRLMRFALNSCNTATDCVNPVPYESGRDKDNDFKKDYERHAQNYAPNFNTLEIQKNIESHEEDRDTELLQTLNERHLEKSNTTEICEIKQKLINIQPSSSPKAFKQYKGLYISSSKYKVIFKLRGHKNEKPHMLIEFPIDYILTEQNIETIKKAHQRFRDRLDAAMFWRDQNYLLSGTYREITTFKELLDFYSTTVSAEYKKKVELIRKRYFSGQYGNRKISTYCVEAFERDYLNRSVPDRQRSDRNQIIKIIQAASNKAADAVNIKIDLPILIRKGARSRAASTDKKPPSLSTFCLFLEHAYKWNHNELGLELILQYMASLRVYASDHLKWSEVNQKDKFIDLPDEKSKTNYKKLAIPQRCVDILSKELERQSANNSLTKTKNKIPEFVFESSRKRGKSVCNFDTSFKYVKDYLIANADALNLSDEQLKEIKRFTRKQIRNIVVKELHDIGALSAQIEKCQGREPNDVGIAYVDLSLEKLSELKDKMIEKLEAEHPVIKDLFDSLCN